MRAFLTSISHRTGTVAGAALLLAACESTPVDAAPVAPESDVAAQVSVTRAGQRPAFSSLAGTFADTVKLTGTLCDGAVSAGAGQISTANINASLDALGQDKGRSGTCRAEFDLTIPAGYQLVPSVCVTVNFAPTSESARARIRFGASFPELGGTVVDTTKEIRAIGLSGERTVCGLATSILPTTCSVTAQTVKFAVTVNADTPADSLLDVMYVEADATYARGALFRRCGRGAEFPAPAGNEQQCGGPNSHPCTTGLTCRPESVSPSGTAGRCLSSTAARQPRQTNQICNARLTPACASDHVCAQEDPFERNGELYGSCRPRVSSENGVCGGTTGRTCAAGLFCDDYGTCKSSSTPAGGGAAREGQSCDGKRCALGLTCDAGTLVCRKGSGAWGEACKNTAPVIPCDEGLACQNAVCLNVDAPAGASCLVDGECRSRVCDEATRSCR